MIVLIHYDSQIRLFFMTKSIYLSNYVTTNETHNFSLTIKKLVGNT